MAHLYKIIIVKYSVWILGLCSSSWPKNGMDQLYFILYIRCGPFSWFYLKSSWSNHHNKMINEGPFWKSNIWKGEIWAYILEKEAFILYYKKKKKSRAKWLLAIQNLIFVIFPNCEEDHKPLWFWTSFISFHFILYFQSLISKDIHTYISKVF